MLPQANHRLLYNESSHNSPVSRQKFHSSTLDWIFTTPRVTLNYKRPQIYQLGSCAFILTEHFRESWYHLILYLKCRNEWLGSLRSATATSTKTSPQNITLLYHKSFAIIPSCSRLTLSVKYPRNELVREISEWKERNERFTFACSRCRQNLEFGDSTSLLCRGPQKYLLKSVLHVQHDYLWFFNQSYHCFVRLLLPSPSLFLKLPIDSDCPTWPGNSFILEEGLPYPLHL